MAAESTPPPLDVLVLVDGGGLVKYVSPEGAALLGGSTDDARGRHLLDVWVVHAEDRERAERGLARLLEAGGVRLAMELRVRDPRGGWRVIAISAENLAGHPEVGFLVIHARDLTARKDLEEQLLRAQRMQAVGRLAGGIAHDFRNVLTVITGSVDLARQQLPREHPALLELAEIAAAADRATSLTQQLLKFSRRRPSGRGSSDLNEALTGMQSLLQRLMGDDVVLAMDLEPGLPRVAVEATQIEQVVLNLAVNAREAMPGGGRFTLRTSTVRVGTSEGHAVVGLEPGRYALVRAEDEGVGMDPETLGRVFEPFFTTRSERGGTGLGLATLYAIITGAGGQVHVRSEPGRGTLFKLYLPLLTESD